MIVNITVPDILPDWPSELETNVPKVRKTIFVNRAGIVVTNHEWPKDGTYYAECAVGGHNPPCRRCVNCGEMMRPEDAGKSCK